MVQNRIIFFATSVQPNPEEIDYWVDLSDNPYGGSIKYFNGTEWVRLAASGGMPDLSNYYTKTLVNKLLNDKANVSDVDSKVDDEEVKDVIKDIQFNTSNPNNITMVMFKYDGSNDSISLPIASTGSAGIVTSKDFLDFVKQHQLLELHTEMIDTFADIRAKYLKKLIAGLNIEIDQETNVISTSGNLSVQWNNITDKPDFKPVATSGDYNDLINKLKPGKDVSISEDNVISIAIDSDSLELSLATLQSNIDKEAATARAAETKLGNDIATEKNRAQSAELTISTNLQNEINRSTQVDTQHTNAINKEVQDRKEAIATEVSDRNAAILVETNRAKAKEEELDNKITDHTAATNAALALKADKSDTYTKAQVDAKLSGAYKVKGSSTFEALPKDNNVVGDVYNIINAFNLGGKHYDAGTNVVWTEDGWDALSGSFDTTAIEGSIQEVADNLAQEILDRTQADTTINNNVSSLTNRVKVNEDKLTIINGNESTTGSIANAIKQAKSYTDATVTAELTRADKAELKLTSDLASEVTRAKGAESANATAIANEVERATGVEETLNSNITQLLTQKVDKVEGKGLSTNDYTTPEKNKLAAIEAEANKYVLPAATASALGGVKIGSNITLANGGTISITKTNITSALGVDPTTTYVKKAGDTMTGTLTSASTTGSIVFKGVENSDITNIYKSGGNLSEGFGMHANADIINGLRFNWYDTFWYIGNIRGSGTESYGFGIVDNNDLIGFRVTTDAVYANKYTSSVSTGNAPISVKSTTMCPNLNADMVDGVNVKDIEHTLYISSTIKNYLKILVNHKYFPNSYKIVEYYDGYIYVYLLLINAYSPKFTDLLLISGKIHTEIKTFYDLTKWYIETTESGMNIYIYQPENSNFKIYGVIHGEPQSPNVQFSVVSSLPSNVVSRHITFNVTSLNLEEFDWYGVSWSETSSNPDCTRIGNMDMHRSLPILSMMKPFAFNCGKPRFKDLYVPVKENFTSGLYSHNANDSLSQATNDVNIMIKIPEFWYTDDYSFNTKTHNLKICQHAKSGWNHHKEAYVSAYELYNLNGRAISKRENIPTVNFTRANGRTWARANGFDGEAKWNLYTYEEHRAICHLFLVEYATRNSQKAVNTTLTAEGFRQGGLGSGCTIGVATINGATTYSFIPTGSSDSLGSGSGEVTVTIQLTDSSGHNTSTITRKCNRYRGIENPFGHVWKHTDDVISIYEGGYKTWYKSIKPEQFANNKNTSYKPLTTATVVTGYKTEIRATPTCDFFAAACTNDSESTYWCDYNWDNTDTSEHCLLIGGHSGHGIKAGLFCLNSYNGVGNSNASVGSRLTYLPWAE
ncbi:tail protein [uncultured phage cr35_1]|uniref:tail protein n=1 Tax=uncultured phage cr35_1 TaxID=2986408 RepID=UPI001C75CA05|nr:tail protein [uncultured phage cr35_1]